MGRWCCPREHDSLSNPRYLPTSLWKDLGYHRLKDLEALEHAYQLVIVGLEQTFPPLKSLGAETNLPSQMTQLVGRDTEVEQLCIAVQVPEIRLVTLTGVGGVGKTRLALAAASSLGTRFGRHLLRLPLGSKGRGGDVVDDR